MIPLRNEFGDAAAGDREHVVGREAALALDVGPEPLSERRAVAESRVHGVFEVRMRVDEARQDHGVVVVALGASGGHLDDPPALPAHQPAFDRRPVDGQHPVGGDFGHVASAAAAAARAERRSSRTESQIDAS